MLARGGPQKSEKTRKSGFYKKCKTLFCGFIIEAVLVTAEIFTAYAAGVHRAVYSRFLFFVGDSHLDFIGGAYLDILAFVGRFRGVVCCRVENLVGTAGAALRFLTMNVLYGTGEGCRNRVSTRKFRNIVPVDLANHKIFLIAMLASDLGSSLE